VKNQISHDSINRVEPSAKMLAEQKVKTEADEIATAKLNESENEEKETTTQATTDTDPLGNDKEGSSKRQEYEKNENLDGQNDDKPKTNNFLGGQIFDSEA